jgi:hypothetical protein
VEFFDVFMMRYFGPAVPEDAAAEFVEFALESDFKSGTL